MENKINDEALTVLIEHISNIANRCDKANDFSELDNAFSNLDAFNMEHIEIITWLRTVFVARDRLPNWFRFRDKAKEKLISEGKDPKKYLSFIHSLQPGEPL